MYVLRLSQKMSATRQAFDSIKANISTEHGRNLSCPKIARFSTQTAD